MIAPCSHCGVDHLPIAARTVCDGCFRAWIELSDAGRSLSFEASMVAHAADQADQHPDMPGVVVHLRKSLDAWRYARDAHTKARTAWDALGKLREQRLGLASTEPRP